MDLNNCNRANSRARKDGMIEVKIKETLMRLRSAISAADGGGISGAIAELDRIVAERAGELDPQLRHFLKNRSYEKALAYLAGETDIPAGICGGGKR